MSETRVRHPNKEAQPERMCGEPLRIKGFSIACDRPRGHLPTNEHASTVQWHSPAVRVVEPSHPPRGDLAFIRENARRYRIEHLGIAPEKA